MADENYKLAKFQAAVFAEIDMKTAQIKQEAELLKEQELEKNKDIQLDKSYNYIQKKSSEIKKKYKREVAKFSLDKKRELLIKRNEITSRVFGNVTNKLTTFAKSSEYKSYLINSIKKFIGQNNLPSVNLFLSQSDMVYEKDIMQLFDGICPCVIASSVDITIGGFIASNPDKGIYFDETLEQRLSDQKSFYMQHSELVI